MADVLISDLSFSQPLSGDELLPIVQNGTSYKVSVSSVGRTGGTENINGCDNTIVSGSTVSSIVGGCKNTLDGEFSFIGGGYCNYSFLPGSTIGGGRGNTLSSDYGFIGGGQYNTVKSGKIYQFGGGLITAPSIIIGGVSNKIYSPEGFIGSGGQNQIAECSQSATIFSGYRNCIEGSGNSFILGGGVNCMSLSSNYSNSRNFIGTGSTNSIIGDGSNGNNSCNSIINGSNNQIGPDKDGSQIIGSAIVGGTCNRIESDGNPTMAFIGSGTNNNLSGSNAVIVGTNNISCGYNNIIGAGHTGIIYGHQSFIGSGYLNTICADYSSIITGCNNNNLHDNSHIIGSDITTVSGNMLHANTLYLSAAALPTSDPRVPGVVWRDGTDLKISV